MDIQAQVLTVIKNKAKFPEGLSTLEKLDYRYLDNASIDSLGILEVVSDLEKLYEIRFSNDDLTGETFQTPRGVISIVEKYLA